MKFSVVFFILLLPLVNAANAKVPSYYKEVARSYDVPVEVFYAIALNESGLRRGGGYYPWPWTLNIEGKGARYDSYHDARRALYEALDAGKRVDIGIMQINGYWHRHRVDELHYLLLPHISLIEGAKILLEQRERSEDWWEAVGRYHAPLNDENSKRRAERYRQRVKRIYQTIVTTQGNDV